MATTKLRVKHTAPSAWRVIFEIVDPRGSPLAWQDGRP